MSVFGFDIHHSLGGTRIYFISRSLLRQVVSGNPLLSFCWVDHLLPKSVYLSKMNYKPAEASLSGVGSNGHPTRRPHYVMGPFLPSLTNPIWRFDTRDDEVTDTLKSASAISAQLLAPVDSQVAQLKSPIVLEARCGKGGRKVRAPWSKEVRVGRFDNHNDHHV